MLRIREDQLPRACRAVCHAAGLRSFWTWTGPTSRADSALRGKGGRLSRSQYAALRVAWGLWNGRGDMPVHEMLDALESHVLRVVAGLLAAAGRSPEAVEQFLCEQGQRAPSVGESVEVEA